MNVTKGAFLALITLEVPRILEPFARDRDKPKTCISYDKSPHRAFILSLPEHKGYHTFLKILSMAGNWLGSRSPHRMRTQNG